MESNMSKPNIHKNTLVINGISNLEHRFTADPPYLYIIKWDISTDEHYTFCIFKDMPTFHNAPTPIDYTITVHRQYWPDDLGVMHGSFPTGVRIEFEMTGGHPKFEFYMKISYFESPEEFTAMITDKIQYFKSIGF